MRGKILVAAALSLGAMAAFPAVAMAGTGNGAPSGPHYNLIVHGVTTAKVTGSNAFSGNNKNDIFVPLTGECDIYLHEGTTFGVTQPNCTSTSTHGKNTATFTLPTPCTKTGSNVCTGTEEFAYQVWVRGQTPHGTAKMDTCITQTGVTYCTTGTMIVTIQKNKTFTNVTTNLLTVCENVGTVTTPTFKYEPLFGTANATYFWQYTNQGLRTAQFRFYPIETTTSTASLLTSPCTHRGKGSLRS